MKTVALLTFVVVGLARWADAEVCGPAHSAHLRLCKPYACTMTHPLLNGDTLHRTIIGREAGLCHVREVTSSGGLECRLSQSSITYLTSPRIVRAMNSPDLEIRERLPDSADSVLGILQGRPPVRVFLGEKEIDSEFLQRECTMTRS